MNSQETPTQRLKRLAEERVGDLGMTLGEFQNTHRIGRALWARWRDNEEVRVDNDRKIHAALKWAPSSRDDIIEGGEPTIIPNGSDEEAPPGLIDEREVEIWRMGTLSVEEKAALIAALRGRDQEERIRATLRDTEEGNHREGRVG